MHSDETGMSFVPSGPVAVRMASTAARIAFMRTDEECDVTPLARFVLERHARLEHRVEAAIGETREDREDREGTRSSTSVKPLRRDIGR